MRRGVAVALVTALLLSGCATTPAPTAAGAHARAAAEAEGYPRAIEDPAAIARFPGRIAGFERDGVTAYAQGRSNLSASYSFSRGDLAWSATWYQYPGEPDFPSLESAFEVTLQSIIRYHPGTRLLEKVEAELGRGAEKRHAHRATLQIPSMGSPPEGPFYSELWMWSQNGELRKLRVSGPAAHPGSTALRALEFARAAAFLP